jgi:dTDP-glucose 4,6-dehydratase
MQRILITGGAGFIGCNFIRMLLQEEEGISITNVDALTYAGNLASLVDVEKDERYTFVKADITDCVGIDRVFSSGFDIVINFAAESHVDRSILDAGAFVRTNVLGTQVLLEASKRTGVKRFVQVSTDEVYGSLGPDDPDFVESTPLAPNSPYSASKAGADLLVRSYFHTFGMDVVITRCSNNYGPYQFPEKFIPLFITNALDDKKLPLYGDGRNVRDWIHVEDHCRAIWRVATKGRSGEVYNIGSSNEWANIDIARKLLEILDKPESLIKLVKDRPGHDRRYAIDSSKAWRELGWKPMRRFDEGIVETVWWYVENRAWWENIKSGEYRLYYERQYADR